MGEGEIAYNEQFLFMLQCFQKLSAADESKCLYYVEKRNIDCGD